MRAALINNPFCKAAPAQRSDYFAGCGGSLLTFHQSWTHRHVRKRKRRTAHLHPQISQPGKFLIRFRHASRLSLAKQHYACAANLQCRIYKSREKTGAIEMRGQGTHTEWVPVLTRCMMPCAIIALINVSGWMGKVFASGLFYAACRYARSLQSWSERKW